MAMQSDNPGSAASAAMWGGRFDGPPDALFRAFNDSLAVDWRLVRQDIRGSIAWARAIGAAGVLTATEVDSLCAALRDIEGTIDDAAAPTTGEEDVHSWVETRLIERVGDLGRKLHTGRSRNDQVATDLRLWTREAIDGLSAAIRELARGLLDLAEREAGRVFPAYTHLQRAQPITFGHWCVAYVSMFARDLERLADARRRVNVCPLGSAALAGTTYPVDRDAIASELGFDRPSDNSLDAVSDRDFVIEPLAAMALFGTHLSRFAEDLIIYTSAEFGLIELDDGVTSGSSLMPQKRNPDALELLRGKAGRLAAAHGGMLMTVKALPLAYNKDLQEDKEPIFDAVDQSLVSAKMAARVVSGLRVNAERAHGCAMGGYSNATDLADVLVEAGVPFRTAHDLVGRLVRLAIGKGTPLESLSLDELRAVAPQTPDHVFERLTAGAMLSRRDVFGGTAPGRVHASIASLRSRISSGSRA